VVDRTLQLGQWHLDAFGLVDSPGAMNEGLADYFSSALAGDPNVGEYASKDISPSLDVIRTLDNHDACPGTLLGEVHFDSTLFSGGLWAARASLADDATRARYDAALYAAMLAHPGDGDLGYEDLAQIFLASLQLDLPAGAAALEAEMTKRGVLPGCSRVLAWTGAAVAAPRGNASPGQFSAPGTSNLGGDVAPGIVQIAADLPPDTATVTLTFTSAQQAAAGAALGPQGTPFAPIVLAKVGAPIQWTTKGKLSHDAPVAVDAKGNGGKILETYTATFDVPEGAGKLYVQIASKGERDGAYDQIGLAMQARPASGPPQDGTPGDGTVPAANAGGGSSTSAGCGCSVPGSTTPAGGLALGALGLGLLAFRRRRARV
jgi:MYXO-CTERM domain-containing protein